METNWDAIRSAVASVPDLPSRAEYEAACARLNITDWPDHEIYEVVARLDPYTDSGIIAHRVAAKRRNAIDNERKNAPKIVVMPRPEKPLRRLDCGCLSREAMTTSRGLSCPNCYDKMSE